MNIGSRNEPNRRHLRRAIRARARVTATSNINVEASAEDNGVVVVRSRHRRFAAIFFAECSLLRRGAAALMPLHPRSTLEAMTPSTRKYEPPSSAFQLKTCWASTRPASPLRVICRTGATVACRINAGEPSVSNVVNVWKFTAAIGFGWEP